MSNGFELPPYEDMPPITTPEEARAVRGLADDLERTLGPLLADHPESLVGAEIRQFVAGLRWRLARYEEDR